MVVSLHGGGRVRDSDTFTFTIDTRPLEITSVTPDNGPAGTQVTIEGRGFGTIPRPPE